MASFNIKTGDTVKVIAGKDKGATGTVTAVFREDDRVVVEGINLVKKHVKAMAQGQESGIVSVESPIHVSNVMLVEGDGVTRVGFKKVEGTKKRADGSSYTVERSVRISRKTGEEI